MNDPAMDALVRAAADAAARAYCPYSRFAVGAALRTARGKVYTGCNVENASYGLTLCAERVALGAAVAAGEREFSALAIVASGETLPYPCGACRQVLVEFCAPSLHVRVARLADPSGGTIVSLGELLPHAFRL